MSVPENPPAFPRDERYLGHNGMTLRDWFAGQVLPYAASRSYSNDGGPQGEGYPPLVARFAYRLADAMLAERERPHHAA